MPYCLWANTQLPGQSESTETGAQPKQRHRGPLTQASIYQPHHTTLLPLPEQCSPYAHLGFMRAGARFTKLKKKR